MSDEGAGAPLLLLDACCLINLLATGRAAEVLAHLPYRCAVSRWVAERKVLLGPGGEPPGSSQPGADALEALAGTGHLSIRGIESGRERSAFVRFAVDLDDGEASVCALALVHAGTVATDDRKALRLLSRPEVGVPTVQTPELLHHWARLSRADPARTRAALRAIRDRGRFYPRRDAPFFDWWESCCR